MKAGEVQKPLNASKADEARKLFSKTLGRISRLRKTIRLRDVDLDLVRVIMEAHPHLSGCELLGILTIWHEEYAAGQRQAWSWVRAKAEKFRRMSPKKQQAEMKAMLCRMKKKPIAIGVKLGVA